MEYLAQLSEQTNARLDQFEADWLRGEIPDVASYLSQSVSDDPRSWRDFVELDMEYRWRRFQHGTSESDLDPFGFPQYPKLEHYADLLEESLRPHLLNPELLAEEYRVRTFWGDRPDRQQFLERLADDAGNVESALDHIDAELLIEGMSNGFDHRQSEESTQLFDQRSTEIPQKTPGTEPPPRIGKYRMDMLLGRGGFGEVWKAYDSDLNRYVALKFPHPKHGDSEELYQSFRREAEKMASLERVPGVVPVYEAGEDRGIPYIASSFVDGQDLSVRHKHEMLSFAETSRIVADVADTLHRAHLKDLFHRDVKLSNILIDNDGQVFLSDFGLCVSEEEQLHEGHSATGTYAYMAPEQIQGNSHRVDGRADIYALGVVLYRLLSGRLPFIGNSSVDYMEQALKKSPRPLRSINDQIPEELERICVKCLNKNVEHRYATAGDLARDLRNWLSSLEPVPVAETAPAAAATQAAVPPRRTFSQRYPLLMMLSMLIIAVGGVLAWKPEMVRNSVMLAGLWTEPEPVKPVQPVDPVPNQEEGVLYPRDATPTQRIIPEIKPEWRMLEGLNAFEVTDKTNAYFLKSIGELLPGESYHIQVDLPEMPLGSSGGIFFGMSETLLRSTDTSWQSVIIERQRNGTYRLLRKFDASRDDEPHGYSDFDHVLKIDKNEAEKITLRIAINEEGLQEISVNGKSYDHLAEEFRTDLPKQMIENDKKEIRLEWASPEDVHGTGRFGFTCPREGVIFADPVVNGEPYIIKSGKTD